MPCLIYFKGDEQLSFEYRSNLYATTLLNDAVARRQVRNIDFMERLVEYITDHAGSLFSSANIAKYLKSQLHQVPSLPVHFPLVDHYANRTPSPEVNSCQEANFAPPQSYRKSSATK